MQGFGQCKLPAVPSCSGTSATSGRKVGYYQGTNGFTSGCNQMPPSQIPTEGVSHLIYAFADIDPNSFEVTIAKGEQESWYTDFNALASDSLKTFIAIGGGAFSNPNAETFTTWSDMASSSDNRAKFISSLKSFMEKYGFKGVDLDWEFPGEASRGGKPEDTANLVSLVKEMRESFGTTYGISAALPLYYGDLKAIDVAGMAGSVDL
jgi:chitinase